MKIFSLYTSKHVHNNKITSILSLILGLVPVYDARTEFILGHIYSQYAVTGQIHYINITSRETLEMRLVGKGKGTGGYWGAGGTGGKTLPYKNISREMLKTPSCWACHLGHYQHGQRYIHAGSETAYRSGDGISIDQRNAGHKGLLNRVHPWTSGNHIKALF